MDFLLNRYRNLTVLLVVIVLQLLLLAYQVKTNKDVPLMRVWAVSAITPVEESLEFVRRHTIGVAEDYFVLIHVREQNEKLQRELDNVKLENHHLRNELSTADRLKVLNAFQENIPSKTLAARVIGNGTGANSKTIFVDRGITAGIENGMAVINPDGIVGKVVAAYPTASLVMLMTDPSFAAGVISQKNHVHGTLKGMGYPKCRVDYVQNEEKVEAGEWFYTAGDDGVFPRGFPVGQTTSVRNGHNGKEIIVTPSGWQGGLDEVLIVTEGVHQQIPAPQIASAPVKILPPPSDQSNAGTAQQNTAALATDADKLRQEYKQIGEQEKIQFGQSGTKPPDFSKVGKSATPVQAQAPAPGQSSGAPNNPNAPNAPKTTTPSAPGGAAGAGAALKPPMSQGTPPPARQALTTIPKVTSQLPARSAAAAPSTASAPPKAPRRPAPILETDPADADPTNEAIAERVQRERSNAKVISEDKNTEVLAPAAPPKSKSTAPKTTPQKGPSSVPGPGRSGGAAQ